MSKKKSRRVEEADGYGTIRFRTSGGPCYDPAPVGLVWLEIKQNLGWGERERIDRAMYLVDPDEIRAALEDVEVAS